jgi:hypothetical protein
MGNPAAVLSQPTAPANITVEVTLLTVFRIDMAENTNRVQQMRVPAWNGRAAVQEFHQSRMHGYTITPSDGFKLPLRAVRSGVI